MTVFDLDCQSAIESAKPDLREGLVDGREYHAASYEHSPNQQEFCPGRVGLTYLNESHAICGHPQRIGPDRTPFVNRMTNDLTVRDHRIGDVRRTRSGCFSVTT
jgi:hypothetical protein